MICITFILCFVYVEVVSFGSFVGEARGNGKLRFETVNELLYNKKVFDAVLEYFDLLVLRIL